RGEPERRGAARRLLRRRLRPAPQLRVAAAPDEPARRARHELLVPDAVRRWRALRGREPGLGAARLLLLRRLRGLPAPRSLAGALPRLVEPAAALRRARPRARL